MNFEISAMAETDAAEVIELEQRATKFGWTLKSLLESMESGCQANKITTESEIRGYCIARDTGYEIEILNLVIDPDYQHRGLARQLVGDLVEKGLKSEREAVILEMRRSNFRAGKLYMGMGFEQVGIRKRYYTDIPENEDALVMRRILGKVKLR